jgi:CheY-like chemotaxis protein
MESVGRLAGGVAHDFNNNLGVILGHVEMLLMEMAPNDPLYSNLREIQESANRAADLTRQLLAFARKQTIAPKVIHLNDTVEGMLKMLRRIMGEDIDLVWRPDTDLWPVKMDPSQIDQILANLCVNARDAISGVGKVTIETENVVIDETYRAEHPEFSPGEYVVVAVSDDGVGMDRATIENVFEPFFTTKALGKGTGLGLSTVYGIVKQNSGFINVYSEPGEGTTFRIYIPRHHSGEVAPGIPDTAAPPRGQGETVLLVEDDSTILSMTKAMLQSLGYRVLTADKPDDAITEVRETPEVIHLLLTDVVMPGMSGKDLAEQLVKIRPDIRTLYMSGYTANVIAHHGVLDEGVHFIEKPFSMKTLGQTIREVLDETRADY